MIIKLLKVSCRLFLIGALVLNSSLLLAQDIAESPGIIQEIASGDALVPSEEKVTPVTKSLNTEVDLDLIMLDVDYKSASLSTVLRSLAYTYGLNLVTTKDLKGTVTVTLTNVSLSEALEAILSTNGYTFMQRGRIVYVLEGPDAANVGMITKVVALKYLMAEDAMEFLGKALSGKGDVKAIEPINSLLITDYPSFIDNAEVVLSKIDIPPTQVIIEAKVLDINHSDLLSLGVSLSASYAPIGSNRGLFGRKVTGGTENMSGTIDLASAIGTTIDPLITAGALTLKEFAITSAQISALVENANTDLLAAPSIATLNGLEAKIVIGERYPYTEKTQTTTGTTETTKFVDIGTILTVTPYVSPDGYITMDVHPEVSSFDEAVADVGPRIITREATATIRVKMATRL